jgi:hypothetical protein
VRLQVQPCRPAELHQFGRGVKIFRVALTLLVKPEGALLGQRAHTNPDLRHEAEIDLTALHCLEREPPTKRATFIQTPIDEKYNNLLGGFAVAITS